VVSDLPEPLSPTTHTISPGAGPVHLLQRVRTIPPAGRSMVRFWMDSKALIEGLGIQTAEQAMWPMRSALGCAGHHWRRCAARVTQRAASLARKATIPAISPGWPTRPNATLWQ
jgi:hypothetical protein